MKLKTIGFERFFKAQYNYNIFVREKFRPENPGARLKYVPTKSARGIRLWGEHFQGSEKKR